MASLVVQDNGVMDITHGLQLVPAEQADVERICSWVTSSTQALTFAGPSLVYPFTAGEFFESAAGRWESFVLRAGSAAVATGALEDRGQGEVRIGRVLVDPDHRGRGLGRTMMKRLIDRAAARPGAACLTLSVFEGNRTARALYESLGFTDSGGRVSVHVEEEVWIGLQLELELASDIP